MACSEVAKELRKGLLAGAEKDRVGVRRRFGGQRRDMQATESHKRTGGTIRVGEAVGAVGVGDVDLNDDQVGPSDRVVRLDMFVHDRGVIGVFQIRRQRREAERWKQGVLDRAPERAGGFGQGREDESDAEFSHSCFIS